MLTAEQAGASGSRRRRVVRLLDFGLARRPEHGRGRRRRRQRQPALPGARARRGWAADRRERRLRARRARLPAAHRHAAVRRQRRRGLDGAHPRTRPSRCRRAATKRSTTRSRALIARAMAKDPAQRHGSAAAFRYELNTVMDMLDMGRRRTRGSGTMQTEDARELSIAQAFERSRIPQAIVLVEGTSSRRNRAFNKFVNRDEKGCEGISLADTSLDDVRAGPRARAAHRPHRAASRPSARAQVLRSKDRAAARAHGLADAATDSRPGDSPARARRRSRSAAQHARRRAAELGQLRLFELARALERRRGTRSGPRARHR